MNRTEKIDPSQSNDKSDIPPESPRNPIERDSTNAEPAPGLDSDPEHAERPDLDWAEHED